MNVVPLRGVTIQRPWDPVSASMSMFRSKSFMVLSVLLPEEPLHEGRRNAAHIMPNAASNSQPTEPKPPVAGSPVRHKMLGWVWNLAPS